MTIENDRSERQVLADCRRIKREISKILKGKTLEERFEWYKSETRRIEAEHGIKIKFAKPRVSRRTQTIP